MESNQRQCASQHNAHKRRGQKTRRCSLSDSEEEDEGGDMALGTSKAQPPNQQTQTGSNTGAARNPFDVLLAPYKRNRMQTKMRRRALRKGVVKASARLVQATAEDPINLEALQATATASNTPEQPAAPKRQRTAGGKESQQERRKKQKQREDHRKSRDNGET